MDDLIAATVDLGSMKPPIAERTVTATVTCFRPAAGEAICQTRS